MKRIFVIICLIFIVSTAHSQILISILLGDKLNSPGLEFGLEGGVNWSTLSLMDSDKSLPDFNLGFYFNIRMKEPWYLYTGLLVKSRMGTGSLSNSELSQLDVTIFSEPGNYDQVVSYFQVPALAKYRLKNHFYFEAGPQFALAHKAYIEYNSDVEGATALIRQENLDQLKRLDVGGVIGFGYRLMKGSGMTLGLKYYHGFGNVYKIKGGVHNRSLFLKLNIPIGAAKKKEE